MILGRLKDFDDHASPGEFRRRPPPERPPLINATFTARADLLSCSSGVNGR